MSWNPLDQEVDFEQGTPDYIDEQTYKLYEILYGKNIEDMEEILRMVLSKDRVDKFLEAGRLGDNKFIYPFIQSYFLRDSYAKYAAGILLYLNSLFVNDDIIYLKDIIDITKYNFI